MSGAMTPHDAANVCRLLQRMRAGEIGTADRPDPAAIPAEARDMFERVENYLSAWIRAQGAPVGDAGPAFPQPAVFDGAREQVLPASAYGAGTGMTLRDYFIAHAPAEPQPWFSPVVEGEEPHYPKFPSDLTAEESSRAPYVREFVGVMSNKDIEGLPPRLREYAHGCREARIARGKWHKAAERARFAQWPGAWADEQLRLRQGAAS